MAKPTHLLEAALAYARDGYKVFPCEELAKQPHISAKDGGKGVHDATTDEKQIAAWWSRWPNANVALHAESFWVLDVDKGKGGEESLVELIRQHGPLPATLTQTSGSGGKHFLFANTAGAFVKNSAGFLPGLDTRSQNGYILAAPSATESGTYSWDNLPTPIADAPSWLLALVQDKREGFKQSERSESGSRNVDDTALAGYLHNALSDAAVPSGSTG